MDVILVPGLWFDASSWDGVIPLLKAAGHTPHPLNLPGVGRGEASDIDMDAWIAATVQKIDELEGVIALVGHSGGGNVVYGAVDARPTRIARAVYLDTFPPADGGIVCEYPVENGVVPFPGWDAFDPADVHDLGAQMRAELAERALDVPAAAPTQPIALRDERRHAVPATVIMTSHTTEELRGYMAEGAEWARELTLLHALEMIDLPAGHWPQFTRPAEVGEVIVQALAA